MIKKLFTYKNVPQEFKSPAAFEKVYLEYRDFIRTSIYWMVRNQAVHDLVQDTFVKAWGARESFKGDSSIKTWLYRIAMNRTKDYLKKKTNHSHEKLGEEDGLSSTEKGLEQQAEIKDLIDKGLMALTLEERELFILFYKLELTHKEIASLKEVPVGTVKSQLFYARGKFKEALKETVGVQ